jgi:stearoyl-CoA desaturase (delta-9 desaturase)
MQPRMAESAPSFALPRGVSVASRRAVAFERRLTIAVVIIPSIGLLLGIVLAFRSQVGRNNALLLLAMYSINILGIGVGFHRLFAHRAFRTIAGVRALLAVAGSMAAQGPLLYWAAVHRRHHSYSDRPGDPHSPHLHEPGSWRAVVAFWHAHMGWLFTPEVHDFGLYIPDLLRDRLLVRMNRLYFLWVALGLAAPAAAGAWLNGGWSGAAQGLLWGGVVRIALTHHTTWSVNSICHIYGSRPFRTKDYSRNNPFMALVAFGEGWHNNHHAFPSSAMHGLRWWEIDFSGYAIRTLEFLHLAWDVKRPSAGALEEASIAHGGRS